MDIKYARKKVDIGTYIYHVHVPFTPSKLKAFLVVLLLRKLTMHRLCLVHLNKAYKSVILPLILFTVHVVKKINSIKKHLPCIIKPE